ncbi:MAG TPA: BamA/TamA family outer membrane protein [Gemmatimonadales bacterium]|nr:BamA/TamA family outer membrane protein [Gemmatimonadales bacterium]
MLPILVTAVLAATAPPRQAPSSAGAAAPRDTAGAYLDADARRLVATARSRRETIDRSITSYRTTMRERIGVGIRALRRDRMLYRRELALRIDWRRDSVTLIEVVGARQTIPIAVPEPKLPEDLKKDVGDYAFDPANDRLTVGWGGENRSRRDSTQDSTKQREDVEFKHPLAPGSEADYRYAVGDSSAIVFADGRTIRLRELKIIPRRLDFRLMSGSFWIDEGSHAVVRALIRPARAFDIEQDLSDEDVKDIPGFVKPIRIEVRFITIDYGLWTGRWWLPRVIAMDAVATAGSVLAVPMRYERLYDNYEVTGDTAAPLAPRPPVASAAEDSTARAACHAREESEKVSCRCENGRCQVFVVNIPTDTAALLTNASLPPPFGSQNDTLISTGEMDQLVQGLGDLPQAPWQFTARPPRWGLGRYNRIEGLALGAKGQLELGRLTLDGTGRIATTDATLDVEGGALRETGNVRFRLAGYYRLAAVDPTARSLAIGNSLNALFLGRDDGDYFRAAGGELTIKPAITLPQSFSIRAFAEQQRVAIKRTDFSIPNLINDLNVFRPNITAEPADQFGASVTFRTQRGIDPERTMVSTDVTIDGAAGTFDYGRASTTLRAIVPMTRRVAGAIEVAGGISTGRVPIQSYWYLGGPGTLRGYDGAATTGDAFWRARAELGNRWPGARVVLFSDVARADSRDRLSLANPLASVGVGVSIMDGLFRVDLARALRSPTGWRLDLYSDAAL